MLVDNDESASTLGNVAAAETHSEAVGLAAGALAPFERVVAMAWNPREWCDAHTVVAVSGGADSVALLRAMAMLKAQNTGQGALIVAHLDHLLRAESKEDAAWLKSLTLSLGLPFEIGSADIESLSKQQGNGLEAAGRHARYEFLRQTAEKLGARFVVTAHTADDQAETVLHRIVRGTGLAGLAGIPGLRRLAESVTLVRPMLSVTRAEVLGYLAALGQDYRTDTSNEDMAFTRNRVRHQLLPNLRESFNSEVVAALLRLAAQASETQKTLDTLAARLALECVAMGHMQPLDEGCGVASSKASVQIDCPRLGEQPEVLIREVCKWVWREAGWPMQAMGYREWQLLAGMVKGQLLDVNFPANVRARRVENRLLLECSSLS